MRILTGKDKSAYERLLGAAHADATAVNYLRDEIGHLTKRVAELTEMWRYERERADRAVDALLAAKGLAPVRPDTPMPPILDTSLFDEDPEAVAEMQERIQKGGLPAVMDEA